MLATPACWGFFPKSTNPHIVHKKTSHTLEQEKDGKGGFWVANTHDNMAKRLTPQKSQPQVWWLIPATLALEAAGRGGHHKCPTLGQEAAANRG